MKINNISIIGLGLIGGSIAKSLKESNLEVVISGLDKKEVTEAALKDGNIDLVLGKAEDAIKTDLIFLCLPVNTALDVFKLLAPQLRENTILTDVSGVKLPFQKIWEEVNSKGIYIGGHPMSGKEKGGYENSDPLLFENSIYALTENLDGNEELKEFRKVIESLGANILYIPAKQHDVIAASVSHLPQLISVSLVNTASLKTDSYNFLDLAAGGFRDMTRIAASDFEVWRPVITENRGEILTAIVEFQHELEKLKKYVEENKLEEIADYFEQARKHRDEIPQNTKGFLRPLQDIFVFVKDEPCTISKISTALYNNNINIKDIELLKIREGSGGTFRLSFENQNEARQASEALRNMGYIVK